jgi:hypothetical protein
MEGGEILTPHKHHTNTTPTLYQRHTNTIIRADGEDEDDGGGGETARGESRQG